MGLLDGKVALITGAARGIGRSIALKYASEGANVAFTDLVINEAAEQTVKDIEAFGHKVKAYASNAADFEETQKVVDQVVAEFGRIDILVNNAGITKDGLMLRMSEALSSVVGVFGNAGQCNYSASKAGPIGLAKSIAKEMGPRGIRANCIAPGFIVSAMTEALPEKVRDEWIQKIPLRRGGTTEDIANVATFLASDMASYVSGQVIQVDGAMN